MKLKLKPSWPFDPMNWPFFYGWVILFAGTVGILMSMPGQTIGVSLFTDPLISSLGISRNNLSLAYMLGTIGSSLLLPWAGRMYDQLGARIVALLASIGMGITLAILSQIDVILLDIFNLKYSWTIVFPMVLVFLLLRFSGQGVLTLASRNMTVVWFNRNRGFATGFSNVFVSLGFSFSPVVMNSIIQGYSWRGAWLILALISLLVFPLFVLLFFRNKPEDSGLMADGNLKTKKNKQLPRFPIIKDFTVSEAKKSYTFWVCSLMLAMQALFITAFTFHVVSIFESVGSTKDQAVTIFQPIALISVVTTLVFSIVSDYVSLKPLYLLKGVGAILGIFGVVILKEWDGAYVLIIIGNGLMIGLFSVLMSVTWSRYFGNGNIGAITGKVVSLMVFGSSIGPVLYSWSFTYSGNYELGSLVCLVVYLALTIAVFWIHNPQNKLKKTV